MRRYNHPTDVKKRAAVRARKRYAEETGEQMRAAMTWGALIGVASYLLVGLGLTVAGLIAFGSGPASLDANPGKLTLGCTSLFLLLFAFSAAGFFTGRATLNAGMGALAGMLAFAVYGALVTVYAPGGSTSVIAQDATAPGGWVSQVMAIFVTVTIPLGIAALMGWLGGRPGAMRARKALQANAATSAPVDATSMPDAPVDASTASEG